MKPKAIAISIPRRAALPVPQLSFGPFVFLDTLPWLLIASLCRVAATRPGGGIFLLISQFFILMALVSAICRLVEISSGQTHLSRMSLPERWQLARRTLPLLGTFLLCGAIAGGVTGMGHESIHLLMGLDGVAFDQATHVGRLWSIVIAISVMLLVIEMRVEGMDGIHALLKQIGQHWLFLLPATILCFAFMEAFTLLQGMARAKVVAAYVAREASDGYLVALFFAYVVSFATLRLWIVIAIFCYFLQRSCRNNTAN